MARIKSTVVTAQPPGKPLESAPAVESTTTTKPPSYSSASGGVCPRCNEEYALLSLKDFSNHVASCSGAGGAAAPDDDSDSSLSPPPSSLFGNVITGFNVEAKISDDFNAEVELPHPDSFAAALQDDEELTPETIAAHTVRPYVDRESDMVTYNDPNNKNKASIDSEEAVASESDDEKVSGVIQDSEGLKLPTTPKSGKKIEVSVDKFPFPKFTELKIFEEFLENTDDMSYEQLYERTSVVTRTMMEYQAEWDTIDEVLYDYEENQKYEQKKSADLSKAVQDANTAEEDEALVAILKSYEHEIGYTRKEFLRYEEWFRETNPDQPKVLELIGKLRDPVFNKAFRKRQKALNNQDTKKELIDKPIPEAKITKDEIELEKRKRGRLTDQITFDDMNQADAYGFTYSTNELNRGRQPLPNLRLFGKPKADNSYGRPNRHKSKAAAPNESQQQSEVQSPTDEESLPSKRTRMKPKKLGEDAGGVAGVVASGAEVSGASSTKILPSGVRVFASGKRVGRPKKERTEEEKFDEALALGDAEAKARGQTNPRSKLHQMFRAQSDNEINSEVIGGSSNAQSLAPEQEAQLHDAAESLVNQTVSDAVPAKRRGRGGRPRKVVTEGAKAVEDDDYQEVPEPLPKPKGKGGRPRKHPRPEAASGYEIDGEQAPKRAKVAGKSKAGYSSIKAELADAFALPGDSPVFQSTEQEDTSANTSRPTTSSSNNTTTTVDSLNRTRTSTRERSKAPASYLSKSNSSNPFEGSLTSTNGGQSKRKRGTADTETVVVVDTAQVETGPPRKKRRPTTPFKQEDGEDEDHTVADQLTAPVTAAGKAKRKHTNIPESSIEVAEASEYAGDEGESSQQRNKTIKKSKYKSKADAEAAKKANSEKSSNRMKERWGDGLMAGVNEKRMATNRRRNARRQRETARIAAGGLINPNIVYKSDDDGFVPDEADEDIIAGSSSTPAGPSQAAAVVSSAAPAPAELRQGQSPSPEKVATEAVAKKVISEAPPQLIAPAPRPAAPVLAPSRAGRIRKPTTKFMGFDGAGDSEEEDYEEYAEYEDERSQQSKKESEYEKYQALTSPGHHNLGKRVRKPMFDLSAALEPSDEDGDDFEF